MSDRTPSPDRRGHALEFPRPVWRLRLRWSAGEGWRVEERVRVAEMTLPRSAALPATRPGQVVGGFWFEVQDGQGDLLYRGRTPHPAEPSVEVFGRDGRPHREPKAAADELEVEILVPEVATARAVLLVSDRSEQGEAKRRTQVLHRIDFDPRKG